MPLLKENEIDWPPRTEGDTEPAENIIQSMFWDLPESSLDGWRPFSKTLLASDLYGPAVGHGHGIDFRKNLMFAYHGPRGAAKTCSLSYILAKIIRAGNPVWTNYPISFFVSEKNEITGKESQEFVRVGVCRWLNMDGTVSYYESMPLDMDKFYTFNKKIRNGAVGIDELQYFVEARTSGKYQNRVLSYQIMQIRKTANTFGYTVQNPRWVDGRFGWSADFTCECYDLSKKNYDHRKLGRELEEGEYSRWTFRDISGVMTGIPYSENEREIGPYQFHSKVAWGIYPTHYVIDPIEAAKGPDRDKPKKDLDALIASTIELVANEYLEQGGTQIPANEMLDAINSRLPNSVSPRKIGSILSSMGIRRPSRGSKFYDASDVFSSLSENK
jgi:hypothetical protein